MNLISGKKYWSDWTPFAAQQFEYVFDDIGNRTQTKAGGDSRGAALRAAAYSANSLNQITQRDLPGTADIIGAASTTATNVNVNDQLAFRRGEYYQVPLAINNGSAAQWPSVTNRAVQNGTTNSITGNLFLAMTPEVFSYDADGNLTNDGRWGYAWDGENRLTWMAAPITAPAGSCKGLTFAYDWQGRRISKVVSNYTGGAWSKVSEQKFLYDGWNLIADLDSANTLLHSYSWGADLSGSIQGAGGVGGLVSMTVATGQNAGSYFVAYDGNGNVTGLANVNDGNTVARYEYDPFGEVIRATGPMARENPLRWSTKYQDDESDLVYYGYRYYNPSTGRWTTRDPIEERGGLSIYCSAANDLINKVDFWGEDYFIAKVKAFCGVPHRVLVGDDGKGGYYTIEITPVVNHWYEQYRRLCGTGRFDYGHGPGSAKDATSSYDEVISTVKTSPKDDALLNKAAAGLDGQKIRYCLFVQDCRAVERCLQEAAVFGQLEKAGQDVIDALVKKILNGSN